jgi:soluble lytic murein transglycosylase
MRQRTLVWLLAPAMIALGTADALPASRNQHALMQRSKAAETKHRRHGSTPDPTRAAARQSDSAHAIALNVPLPIERPAVASLPPDLVVVKQAIELVRQRNWGEATALAASINDPVAHKLVEWTLLRHPESEAGFERYAAFIHENPDWPSIPLLRRRAEARLWQDRRDSATVRGFLGGEPTSTWGRLALASVLKREGDRAGAEREVRTVWQSAELSAELETAVLRNFSDAITPAADAARMDRRIGAKDFGAAMRAAKRLGRDDETIVKACVAAEANSHKAGDLLAAVPNDARGDLGYVLCRLHWLIGHDDAAAAAKLVTESSGENLQRQDTDEWWRERRVLARILIDLGDAPTAYRVASEAAPPANPYYRAEYHFMAGWIALRFLNDPATATKHFANVDEGSSDPIVRARAAYWRGRSAEAAGQLEEMRTQYEAAARYPTAYYGQLARARLNLGHIALSRSPPTPVGGSRELLGVAKLLYTIDEREIALSFVTDLTEESSDAGTLAALGQLTVQNDDARAMLVIGKTALARGVAMEEYAFPDIGVPSYTPIVGSEIDRCIAYSIVRTESGFDPRDMSPAKAVGLMQVTPEAGRDTAKRYHVTYDWDRLVTDPVYNMQMGVAEVAALLKEYRGSFIMTFAGYNAGRGRVKQWVAQHGDPRDPNVDAVDWVERIPLAETRNYVQRVVENLQVYGARFGASSGTIEPNLHRAARAESSAEPAPGKNISE